MDLTNTPETDEERKKFAATKGETFFDNKEEVVKLRERVKNIDAWIHKNFDSSNDINKIKTYLEGIWDQPGAAIDAASGYIVDFIKDYGYSKDEIDEMLSDNADSDLDAAKNAAGDIVDEALERGGNTEKISAKYDKGDGTGGWVSLKVLGSAQKAGDDTKGVITMPTAAEAEGQNRFLNSQGQWVDLSEIISNAMPIQITSVRSAASGNAYEQSTYRVHPNSKWSDSGRILNHDDNLYRGIYAFEHVNQAIYYPNIRESLAISIKNNMPNTNVYHVELLNPTTLGDAGYEAQDITVNAGRIGVYSLTATKYKESINQIGNGFVYEGTQSYPLSNGNQHGTALSLGTLTHNDTYIYAGSTIIAQKSSTDNHYYTAVNLHEDGGVLRNQPLLVKISDQFGHIVTKIV